MILDRRDKVYDPLAFGYRSKNLVILGKQFFRGFKVLMYHYSKIPLFLGQHPQQNQPWPFHLAWDTQKLLGCTQDLPKKMTTIDLVEGADYPARININSTVNLHKCIFFLSNNNAVPFCFDQHILMQTIS